MKMSKCLYALATMCAMALGASAMAATVWASPTGHAPTAPVFKTDASQANSTKIAITAEINKTLAPAMLVSTPAKALANLNDGVGFALTVKGGDGDGAEGSFAKPLSVSKGPGEHEGDDPDSSIRKQHPFRIGMRT